MRVDNTLATKVTIDAVDAAKSVSAFRKGITSLTNAWKANELANKSAGNTLDALRAKFDGIGSVMELQKRKIDELKSRQEGLDRTNAKQAETWLKLESEIQRAEKQLASYSAQQEKAKSSMGYYESGLADIEKKLQLNGRAYDVLVEKMRVEENTSKVSEERVQNLSKTRDLLTKKLEIQKKELDELGNSIGKESEQYLKQKIRVDETTVAIRRNSTELEKASKEAQAAGNKYKMFGSTLGNIKEKLRGSFVGNLAANAVTSLTGSLGGLIKEGAQASDAMDKFRSTMKLGDFGDKEISKVSGEVKKYANETVYELSDVSNTTAQLAANGIKNYMQLTEAAGNLNAQAGGTAETFKTVGMVMTQTAGAGKLTTENWNQLTDAIPGASGKLQEAMRKNGAFTGNFREAMEKGEISAKEFNKAITQLGMTDAAKKAAESTATFEGAIGQLKASVVTSIQTMIDTIGKKNFTAMINSTTSVVEKLGSTVGKFIKDNKGPLVDIGKSLVEIVKNLAVGAWKTFSGIVEGIGKAFSVFNDKGSKANGTLKILASALKAIAGQKVALQVIGGLFAFKWGTGKVMQGVDAARKLYSKLDLLAGISRNAFRWTVRFSTSAATKAMSGLRTSMKALQTFGKSSLKFTAKVATKGAELGIKGFKTALSGIKTAASVAQAASAKAFSKIVTSAKQLSAGIRLAFATNPLGMIILGVTAVVAAFALLYKHNAKFRKWVNGIASTAKKKFSKLGSETKKTFSNIGKWIGNGWKAAQKKTSAATSAIKNKMSNLNKSATKINTAMANAIKKKTADMAKSVKQKWNDMSKATLKVAKDIGRSRAKTLTAGYKAIQSETKVLKDIVSGDWKDLGKDTKKSVDDMVKFYKTNFKEGYDWLNNLTGGRLGDMVDTFTDKFNSLKDIVANAISGVKSKMVQLVNGVLQPVNNMLSSLKRGLNWVLDKVGAPTIGASWQIPLVSYAQGTPNMRGGASGTHQGGLALVNDGPGEHYREMYRLPNGKVGIFPKERNMIVPLPAGSSVLNGEDTHKLMTMLGIPAYAKGVGAFFKEEAKDMLASPISYLKGVFARELGGLSARGIAGDVIVNFPRTVANQAVDWVKKLAKDFLDKLDDDDKKKKKHKHKKMAWGGRVDTNQMIEIAEENKPEYVIPTDPAKRPRAWQLMNELTSQFVREQPHTTTPGGSAELKELNDKFDSLLGMFEQLLGLNAQQVRAIKDGSFDKTALYRQQGIDQKITNFQTY